ncbi:MAG TPA: HNH endonuclease signature motif containing protein, partial [Trebonia sp.]|nr:HNH endonuclease signature motif containing protein [Trebonia sp.]
AIDLASGPGGIASVLRRGLLDEPFNSKSVILDVGASTSIPPHIRRAVQLRAKGCCEWPGCTKRAVHCDLHHLRHQQHGGETSVGNCVVLCQFHHDTCIHRRGWRLVLHPDATTTAYGPQGQVIHSHGPPGSQPPGNQGPPGAEPPDG